MLNLIGQKKESRQKHTKTSSIKSMFSLDTLTNISKEKIGKKILNDLSFNYLKNYTITSHQHHTCVNHSHKKIIISEISKPNYNKKIFHNLNKTKLKKYPLKLNYKPSKSLKDLLDEEKLLNSNLRPNHSRKNTNTKIELFSTNSTLSFLNIKDSYKDIGKSVKIKNKNISDKSKIKKKFTATFIENKIKQYIKTNSNFKNKRTDKDKGNISSYKKNKKNILKKNKSHDFCLSCNKYINKKSNSSFYLKENKNTNSKKEFYHNNNNNKKYITKSTNLLLENISFSLNKSKNKCNNKNKLNKKDSISKNTTCSINNNKKINLCSLPNLLSNNNIFNFNFNDKNKSKVEKYKIRNSYQNLLEHKKKNKNFNKIRIIDNKKIKKLFKNFKTINKVVKDVKSNKISKSEEKITINKNIEIKEDINIKLNKIENDVKFLLNGFYSIYLKSHNNNKNI